MDGEDTEVAATTNVGEETGAVTRDEAETTVLADEVHTELADALAWSDTGTGLTEPPQYVEGRSVWRWAVVAVAAALSLAAVLALGTVFFHMRHTPTGASVPASPAAVLDGTYRLEIDPAKQTVNGAPVPQPNTDNTARWAFRSACRPTGCIATGTKLDVNNRETATNPSDTAELRFVDGQWQRTPVQTHAQHPQCLAADEKSLVAGTDTAMVTWSLKPQLDGTLLGVATKTTLTDECSLQGQVQQVPLVVTRTGDVPPGVSVADPAVVIASPTTSTASPVGGGPVLDGTYRVVTEFTKQTVNGAPGTGPVGDETYWWAFRSLCTSAGCVATGAGLDDTNHQEATGRNAEVLHFADGHWQDNTPRLVDQPCPGANQPGVSERAASSWSLTPQPGGTLRGVNTITALTNECGDEGHVWQIPLVVSHEAEVSPTVTVADPALFVAPPPRAGG